MWLETHALVKKWEIYIFLKGNELNIAKIKFREINYITVFGTFSWYWEQKVIIFLDNQLEKTAHVHPRYHTGKSWKNW